MKEQESKQENKLYMKWWFWVIIGLMFISTVIAIMPYPSCEETESELKECGEALSELLDALDEYGKSLEEYCLIDYTNPLCDALLPDD